MTNKNNVKESANTKTPLHSDSTADQRTKRKTKNKLRLHSKLKVNVPLSQSLMLILPSLAKHVSASPQEHDVQDTPNDVVDSEEQRSQEDMNLLAKEPPKSDIIENIAPSDKAKAEDANNEQPQNSTLTPSHHLSSLSHPQVHYVPAVSIPTISSGQIPQPTTHTPVTPDLPVTFLPEVISGKYGELHVDANGHYTFVLNPLSPQYVLLHQNQPGTDQFMLHLSNGSQLVVQIPVAGKQDIPTISGDLRGVVIEDHNVDSHGLLSASGKVDVVDPDHDQSSVTAETITGQYGSLSIDANGKWHYQVDNSLSNVQALTSLTSLHESFTIHTKDGTPQTIEMTIGGNDDNAIVSGVDAGSVTEDQTTQVHGQLTVTDSDLGQDHFQASLLTGQFGTLVLSKDGAWTYNLDNWNPAVQKLAHGSTATDIITVHSADGTAHQVTVTINGTNDQAVITSSTAGSPNSFAAIPTNLGSNHVTEDLNTTVVGQLNITDVDSNEAHFSNSDIKGVLGTLHLKDDGGWRYDLDNKNPNVQALGKGSTATDTITIHSADGTAHQITITVNGTNDKAIIGGTSSGAVTEESQLQTSGTLTVTDIDTGEAHFSNTDITGALGTLHLTDSGKWTYDLNNANSTVQALGKGATATDTITVHSADGTPHQVTITVNGTNDTAVITGTDSGAVTEESQLHTSGTLTVTDVDTGEAHFSNTDIVGSFGTLHLADIGGWTYDLDNTNPTVQALGKGASATDTITIHSADGTPHQVTITINGTNDKAVIGGTNTGAVTEESQLQTSGTLTVTDVDNGEAHFSNTDIAGALGSLHLTDSGKWTYDLDNTDSTVQALGTGATATDTITVHSADGTPHQVTITVNGTNDKAVIGGTSSGAVTEESQLQISGTLTVADVDTGEAHFSNTDIVSSFGTLHLTDSGKWTYDLDNTNSTVQALSKGATATDTITVHSADGTPHQVTITVNGTNDKAVVGGTSSGAVTEESLLQTSGTLTVTDVDTGQAHFSNTDIVGSLGTLHLTDTGDWTYDLNNANPTVQALGKGATATDTITVHSADGTPHQVTITVNGTNDAAVIGGTNTGAVTEESQLQTSGTLTVTDVDTGEAHFSNTDITGALGTLHLTDSGKWTYDLDNTNPTVQALGKGATATDTITVHSADGTPHQMTITVNGTNDKAVIGGTSSGAVTEESQLQTSGTLTVTDVDTGEAHFSNTDTVGAFGTLHLTDSGKWTYDLDNTNSTVQALGKGATATDTITVHSADGTPHQVTITVNGTNDNAVIGGQDTGSVDEGHGHYSDMSPDYGKTQLTSEALYADGKLTIADLDTGENEFDPKGGGYDYQGQYGRVNLHQDGTWHYMVDIGHNGFTSGTSTTSVGTTIDQLGDGQSLTDTITVYSKDGTSHDIVVTIHGDNDRPYCSSEVHLNSGKEDLAQTITATELLANTIDVDTNDIGKLTIANLHADHGSVVDNKDGTYTFTPTKDYNGPVHFNYDVTDAHGGITATGANLHLQATGDAATINGIDQGNVTEDRGYIDTQYNLHFDGKLDIVDPDQGEAQFDIQRGHTYHGIGYDTKMGGWVLLQQDGTYTYTIDNRKPEIQKLGSTETLVDKVTIHSVDGTSHEIQITIHGTNDDPKVSSVTTLPAGTEDTDVVLHASDLLTNATDIDHNDAGQLSVANLTADHGKITDNHDGTFTFHPTQDYNGKVSFTYDVQDAHGGSVATSASITLAPIRDSAVISGDDTGSIIEDRNVGHSSLQPVAASGLLSVTDPDAGQDHFQVNRLLGEQAIHDPFGGFLRITPSGAWGYEVANSRLQSLAEGEVEKVVYRVYSADHTAHDITITVTGTNDQPTITTTTLAHGTEDTHYQMQASQFGFTDIDTGDTLHSIAITDLPPATQGKFLLNGHDVTAGQHIPTADISKLQFVPAQDFNGDVQFKYTVNDGHVDSLETTNTLHIDPVADAATFSGDSGSISEDTNIHHNVHTTGSATIPSALVCNGHLVISDVDGQGEAALDLQGQQHVSQDGTYGHFTVTSRGIWVYTADNNSTSIQDLDNGQTLTDSIEVTSKDGTKHSITVTINGTTDAPALHSLSDSGVQHSGPVEGNLLTGSGTDQGLSGAATDTDSNAHLVLQDIQIKDPVSGYVAVRPGQPHTMAGIGTLAIEANGHYTFTPEAGFTGKVPSMVYRVGDDGGNPIGDSSQNSLSIEVTPPLQHTPTVTGQTVSTNEDITRTITTSEFGYSDQDGDALQFVTISSIPSHGLLLLNGNAVTANQQINKADLDAGHLTFTPINNENGANYAQFTFTANDGHKNSASATMVVDVSAVNDAPIVGSSFISSLEDKPHAFTTADFKYSDIDGDALNHITITNVAHGVLSLNGTTVNVGDDVSASDVSSLIFTPTHNYFSSGVSGLGAVQFTANDGHLDSKEGSILINIASVADPATFSGDSTGVTKEDITLQASGTLTASDPDGTAGFTAVQGGAGIAGSKGYGHAHIDVNGHWTYDLDNNHPIVQQLGEGQTDTETITVQSADGTHHDIVVTITGTNDAPILGVNQTSSTTGTLTETDVDVTDSHTFSVVSSAGQFGSLSVDPNTGDYVYTPNTSITGMSYNSATNSYHGVDVFEVKVSDGHTEDSKFITFDASGHVTMSPTGGLVISTTVPQQPTVTTTLPTMQMVTNVAPTNSVTLDLASTSDSGSSNTDNLTNDTTPTITGHTDIPFSKVTIYDGLTPIGHAVSDASGQYNVAVSSLSEGDHNLSAKALAPSSVLPATSSLLSVHIDTQVHIGIQTDPITADNVINAQESNSSIDITGSVSGDYNAGDIVTLDVNGTQHTGVVDAKGHYSIAVPGSELIADADQKVEASIAVTDTAGNSAHATADVTYQVDTQVSVPTITFENAGADNLYSKAEIARGQANTITATITPPGDAKIGEHLVVNGQDHVLDAHTLQHGIQIEVHPGSNVQATMTDEHGNTAGSQGFAASAIPEPIIVRPPSGSHQVSGTLGVPPLLPSLTPVPTAQSGWRIHLPNGQYVTSHHGQYGTLTIDPQTGHLHYQEQAQVHTGPHGSASGVGQHEDKFEVALQGTNQDEVVAHVNIQILSHGPGHSGKLTVGTEVVDMTITPLVHTSHPAPPPPPPVQHDEPDMASQADFTVTLSDDSNLDLTQQTHQEPDQKTSHHGAAAYLDALGITPDATSTTVHDQPADMDIVLAQVDHPDATTHDQAHLDMSDALEHHDANVNHNQDDEHHHHNDVDGLPDIDPNS
ncbi:VCBS domain-containing protein [Vibrio lentus]